MSVAMNLSLYILVGLSFTLNTVCAVPKQTIWLTALKQTIWLMNIVRKMKEHGFDVKGTHPKVHCKAFEDNSGALTIANVTKAQPQTKHINVKYHFFRQFVASGDIDTRNRYGGAMRGYADETAQRGITYTTSEIHTRMVIRLRGRTSETSSHVRNGTEENT